MIEYLAEQIKWVFSGIGVYALKRIDSGKNNYKQHSQTSEYTESDPGNTIVQSSCDVMIELPVETEVQKISKRFRKILDLMNDGKGYNPFTIPQMAEIMNLNKPSELEKYFLGDDDPTFEFMEAFSSEFGVNRSWLIEGKNYPFSNNDEGKSSPLDYFNEIKSLDPEDIFFIRENTDTAQAFIVLRFSEWKYKIFHQTWHISDDVGAGGRYQLLCFYRLIKKLRDKEGLAVKCWGSTLDTEQFNLLHLGEEFPGKYLNFRGSEDPWWDDLTDVYHRYPISEDYERMHGKSFIKAQEIIRWELDKDNPVQ